jgi:hypothetical protein
MVNMESSVMARHPSAFGLAGYLGVGGSAFSVTSFAFAITTKSYLPLM